MEADELFQWQKNWELNLVFLWEIELKEWEGHQLLNNLAVQCVTVQSAVCRAGNVSFPFRLPIILVNYLVVHDTFILSVITKTWKIILKAYVSFDVVSCCNIENHKDVE